MKPILFIILLLFPSTEASQSGQYNYTNYAAINQQMQYQRARAIRNQGRYNQNPARNIIYPKSYNSYPNIERNRYNLQNYSGKNRYPF